MKAFPQNEKDADFFNRGGMDLRDYFAAKAMQAYIQVDPDDEFTPSWAYKMADAMMKARKND